VHFHIILRTGARCLSTSEYIVVISQGSLMAIFCPFVVNFSSPPSSRVSTSTPPLPSLPESFACLRTSFQDRYVYRRLTFLRSCRMRKMRSSAER